MRRITLWVFSTVVVMVLLFSYRTSLNSSGPAAAAPVTRPATTPTPSGSPATTSGTTSGGTKTYDGSVAQTRWGPVQVTITVANGKITDVAVPTYPNGNGRDQEINSYALPILRQETLAAQSANIDTVSGATVTSDGYLESLQAAIDAAHLS
jgi:uncharacterized protein with FMN-binding domain